MFLILIDPSRGLWGNYINNLFPHDRYFIENGEMDDGMPVVVECNSEGNHKFRGMKKFRVSMPENCGLYNGYLMRLKKFMLAS